MVQITDNSMFMIVFQQFTNQLHLCYSLSGLALWADCSIEGFSWEGI